VETPAPAETAALAAQLPAPAETAALADAIIQPEPTLEEKAAKIKADYKAALKALRGNAPPAATDGILRNHVAVARTEMETAAKAPVRFLLVRITPEKKNRKTGEITPSKTDLIVKFGRAFVAPATPEA